MTKMRLRKDEEILEFGDREFHLKPLDLNDMIEGEDEHDLDMTAMSQGKVKMRDLRTIFYLLIKKAVKDGEEPITLEWVGEHFDIKDQETIKGVVNFMSPGGGSQPQGG